MAHKKGYTLDGNKVILHNIFKSNLEADYTIVAASKKFVGLEAAEFMDNIVSLAYSNHSSYTNYDYYKSFTVNVAFSQALDSDDMPLKVWEVPEDTIKLVIESLRKTAASKATIGRNNFTSFQQLVDDYYPNNLYGVAEEGASRLVNAWHNIHLSVALNQSIAALEGMLKGGPMPVFNGNGGLVDQLLTAFRTQLGTVKGAKMPTSTEATYQYKYLAFKKGLSPDLANVRKVYDDVATFGDNHRYDSYRMAIKLQAAKPKSKPVEHLTLNLLYPQLKDDIIQMRHSVKNHEFKHKVAYNRSAVHDNWKRFNDIKNRMMFIGYPEEKVVKFISKAAFKCNHAQCFLTKQWVPSVFLVPVKLLNQEEVQQVNSYYIDSVNNHRGGVQVFTLDGREATPGRRGNGPGRWILHPNSSNHERHTDTGETRMATRRATPDEIRLSQMGVEVVLDNSDPAPEQPTAVRNVWMEKRLSKNDYYHASVYREHRMSPLEFLTLRAFPTEDVRVYSKEAGYRPTPYLGVELEVEREEDCKAGITDNCYDLLGRDFVIFKHDGTLRGVAPFEIVTVPATLEYQKARWGKFLEATKVKSQLTSFKSGNCGMHVHLSRNSFTGLHLAKFMRFFNHADNHRFITKVAQRTSNRYNTYSHDEGVGDQKAIMNSAKRIYQPEREFGRDKHYEAINTANLATVEVRVFRGNLATVAFMKNIEFVHAVWQYTKDCSIAELNYKDFLSWLLEPSQMHHKAYANLEKWLIASGYQVSNVTITKTITGVNKERLIHKRKHIKKVQLVINRKFGLKAKAPKLTEELLHSA